MARLTDQITAILLDIEGTTTPISFVHQVLFPFARLNVREFIVHHRESPDVLGDIADLHNEWLGEERSVIDPQFRLRPEEWDVDAIAAYVGYLMSQDRKSTPLKSLQGKIWQQGYRSGQLIAQVFDDVPDALRQWCAANKRVAIFSSGSVQAQQLLFAHTDVGDLTKYIFRYFDTTTGSKVDVHSYRSIASALGRGTDELVFVSDSVRELEAARFAGLHTVLCVRPGNIKQPESSHSMIESLDGLFL